MSQGRSRDPKDRAKRPATVFAPAAPPGSPARTPLGSHPPDPEHGAEAPTVASVLDYVRAPPSRRLETEARIAAGGMGAIEVVLDRALDRRIALKTIHGHLRSEPEAIRMFLHEARLTGLLDHPHIVPVYELGERDGALYFAMKLVEGKTLAEIIRALPSGVLDTATLYSLLDVFAKVCDALAFAHSRGVLHCDVKAANVMVGDFGQVFLTDWGIARRFAEGTAAEATMATMPNSAAGESIIGTPGYMSPEQACGDRRRLDVRSDVFLLGALLYEILTHEPPFAGHDRAETLALALGGTFSPPRAVAGEAAVPLELERIVLRAMAKSPSERYPTVSALKDDVVRFMRGGAEFPRRFLDAGEVVVREGDPGDAAYIIVEGACEIRKESAHGPQTLRHIGPGDVFGEMAILTRGPRTATVVATEATTLLVVTSAVLEQELAALKPWMARLLESLATRFRDLDTLGRTAPESAAPRARIVHQILMTLETWGDRLEGGGRSMPWSRLAAEVVSQLGVEADAVLHAADGYAIDIDVDRDRVTIADPAALRNRLRPSRLQPQAR